MVKVSDPERPWRAISTAELELRADFLLLDLADMRRDLLKGLVRPTQLDSYALAMHTCADDLEDIRDELRARAREGEQLVAESAAWKASSEA